MSQGPAPATRAPAFRAGVRRRIRAARVLFGRRWRSFIRADELSPLALGVLVGIIAGFGVFCINALAQWMHEAIFALPPGERLSAQERLDPWRAVLGPAAGGLAVGLLTLGVRAWRRREAIDPIEANALYGGRMSLPDSLLLTAGTVLSCGSGASVGLEAGYTQSASGVGSWLAGLLRLRRADVRVLVGCGAAAAIAAAFNAPLAGAFYAFELVLAGYTVAALAPVMAAAITANIVHELLVTSPHAPLVGSLKFGAGDYAVFAAMGVVTAGLGVGLMKTATTVESLFVRSNTPRWLRPAIGGLLVGGLALFSPAVLGAGHGGMEVYFAATHGVGVLLALLFAKMLAASISVGSGFRGGLFFTSLFAGVLFGGLVGESYHAIAPHLASDRIVYVLVGMAGLAAAVIGAPLTMTFLVLGMTGDLSMTTGVLLSVVVATVLVRRTFGYSFSTWRLHLRGETIRSAMDVGWARELTVARLMRREARTAPETMTIAAFRERFPIGSTSQVFLVDGTGAYAGVVFVADAHATDYDGIAGIALVRDLRRAPNAFLTPPQSVEKVLEAFELAEVETLPVVDDPLSRHVVGYVTEAYALRRYSQELERRRLEYSGERQPPRR
ncbi:chloride channel protein [Camelimonas abortus]|uniref:Chloride channel protein n=1 Tax=Camelimonas abortus TaxID=1017184 RepID=A0ABV7LER8_9HYPH